MSCWLADLLIGPPTAFPLLGTGVPWVSLPGPTGVMTHPGRMMSHQSANPILLHCTGFLLRCTELRLDYTDCTLDVFTCNITKLDQCCVLIIRRKKIIPNWDVTWRDLHGWNTQLNLTRPPQPCEYTFAFTIILLRCSLHLWLYHCVLTR